MSERAGPESCRPEEFAQYLPAAHERFPDQPENYFPPATGTFIQQQAYDQVLYLLGVVGAGALPPAPRSRSRRGAPGRIDGLERAGRRRAYLPLALPAASSGALAGAALFGGTPLATLFWLSIGVVAAGPSRRSGWRRSSDRPRDRAAQRRRRRAARDPARTEQQRRGHEVLVVAGSLAPGEESMEYVAEELGVPVLRVPALQRELSLRARRRGDPALRGILRERRPDVLHTHTAKAGATGRLAALLSGGGRPRAMVHTFHGHVLSGYFCWRRERVFRRLERGLALTSGSLGGVSGEARGDLGSFGVAPAGRFVVVPYGFDLPPWSE